MIGAPGYISLTQGYYITAGSAKKLGEKVRLTLPVETEEGFTMLYGVVIVVERGSRLRVIALEFETPAVLHIFSPVIDSYVLIQLGVSCGAQIASVRWREVGLVRGGACRKLTTKLDKFMTERPKMPKATTSNLEDVGEFFASVQLPLFRVTWRCDRLLSSGKKFYWRGGTNSRSRK